MNSDSRRIDSSTARRGDRGQQGERHRRGDQIPQRVGGEECREQNRDRGGIERVGGVRILPRGFELAGDEQPDRDGQTDQHPHLRLQPALLHRVAQEQQRRQHQRDAGNRREQLHADQALPVERRRRRRRRRGWGHTRRHAGWERRSLRGRTRGWRDRRRNRWRGRGRRGTTGGGVGFGDAERTRPAQSAARRRRRRRRGRRRRRRRAVSPAAAPRGRGTGGRRGHDRTAEVATAGAACGGWVQPGSPTPPARAGAAPLGRSSAAPPAPTAASAPPSAPPASVRAASAGCGSGRARPTSRAAARTSTAISDQGEHQEFQKRPPRGARPPSLTARW